MISQVHMSFMSYTMCPFRILLNGFSTWKIVFGLTNALGEKADKRTFQAPPVLW